MIIDELISRAMPMAQGQKTADVRVGLGYTCVALNGGGCGLAYTFRNDCGAACGVLESAGTLIDMPADSIIPWAKDNHPIKAAIGLAAVNAVLNDASTNWDKGNVINAIPLHPSSTLGMVGAFHPILANAKTVTNNIYVFEQNAPEGSDLYPASDIPRYLPQCDTVVLTATSLINHSIDGILPHLKGAKVVCLVGPSAPLCPEVFKRYNITLLAGVVVKKPALLMQIISQGGGTMSMKPAIEQVLVRTQ